MKRLIDYMIHYMQDGQPRRLIHIAQAVKAMGWEAGLSNQYHGVYMTLRNNPNIFKRVSDGTYVMTKDINSKLDLDTDQIREVIFDMLKKHPKQTVAQVWKQLMSQNIPMTYAATHYLLQSDLFTSDAFCRYSNDKE